MTREDLGRGPRLRVRSALARLGRRGRTHFDSLDTGLSFDKSILFGAAFVLNLEDVAEGARDGVGVARERPVELGERVRRRAVHPAREQRAARLVLGDAVRLE